MKRVQCKVEFSPLWGWVLSDSAGQHEVSRSYVYLANYQQIKRGSPSHIVQLFNKMKFVTGEYEFAVGIQNVNPTYLESDIYEEDQYRFHEEDEDEVRRKMTGV